jgi:hypothetical protein
MCPYQPIAALQFGPTAADSAGLALLLLAYAWRAFEQARRCGWRASPIGSRARA